MLTKANISINPKLTFAFVNALFTAIFGGTWDTYQEYDLQKTTSPSSAFTFCSKPAPPLQHYS